MKAEQVAAVLAKPISQDLLASSIPARLAYIGLDGNPRAIPIGFLWTGEVFRLGTVPTSEKVAALQQNPRVALTIDTENFPPHVLLIRGVATVEIIDGVSQDYVEAAHKVVPEGQFADWESGVRALYKTMAMVDVTPDWAKLLDFETTLPKAVEDLVNALGDPR